MLNKIAELSVETPYGLRVRFSDGASGIHELAAVVTEPGEVVAPLRDPAYFARVFLVYGAPTWPNGFDLCPDWLRGEMIAAGELALAAAQ